MWIIKNSFEKVLGSKSFEKYCFNIVFCYLRCVFLDKLLRTISPYFFQQFFLEVSRAHYLPIVVPRYLGGLFHSYLTGLFLGKFFAQPCLPLAYFQCFRLIIVRAGVCVWEMDKGRDSQMFAGSPVRGTGRNSSAPYGLFSDKVGHQKALEVCFPTRLATRRSDPCRGTTRAGQMRGTGLGNVC